MSLGACISHNGPGVSTLIQDLLTNYCPDEGPIGCCQPNSTRARRSQKVNRDKRLVLVKEWDGNVGFCLQWQPCRHVTRTWRLSTYQWPQAHFPRAPSACSRANHRYISAHSSLLTFSIFLSLSPRAEIRCLRKLITLLIANMAYSTRLTPATGSHISMRLSLKNACRTPTNGISVLIQENEQR